MKKIYSILFMCVAGIFTHTLQAQINTVNTCEGENICLVAGSYQGTIQWQSSADMSTWTDLAGATTDTFCFNATLTTYYRARVVNGTCDPVYSDTTLLMVGVAIGQIDTFFYTGAVQQFIVNCSDSVVIYCYGAQGGGATGYSPFPAGGLGAMMSGRFNVSPGDTLQIIVGGRGNDDPSSGGGGGGSGVVRAGAPLIVAGGGAGVDFQDPTYAGIHAVVTNDGVNGGGGSPGAGGTGGSDGGDQIYAGSNIAYGGRGFNSGINGSTGPAGSTSNTTFTQGTFGLGGGGGSVGSGWCNCGGGGGGYSGGGSGYINNSGGGGGSYNVGDAQNNAGGVHSGNGMIIIMY